MANITKIQCGFRIRVAYLDDTKKKALKWHWHEGEITDVIGHMKLNKFGTYQEVEIQFPDEKAIILLYESRHGKKDVDHGWEFIPTPKRKLPQNTRPKSIKQPRNAQKTQKTTGITEERLAAILAAEREKIREEVRAEVKAEYQSQFAKTVAKKESQKKIKDIWNMVTPIATIPKDSDIYNKFWPDVRDGNAMFPDATSYRIACARYRHIVNDTSACASAEMCGDKNGNSYLINTNAVYVPIAAMTMDDEIYGNLGNLPLRRLHQKWMKYRCCLSCADKLSVDGLKFIPFANCSDVFKHCVLCLHRNGSEQVANGAVKMCKRCFDKVSKDGNNQDGDDWTDIMKPIAYRFLGLQVSWHAPLPIQLGEQYEPDTMFRVDIDGEHLWVILEEDGNQHNAYQTDAEYNRLVKIIKSILAKPVNSVLVIRYSPKGDYKTDLMGSVYNLDKAIRLLVVRQWVIWAITEMKNKSLKRLTALYLFYDHTNKHYERATLDLKKSCGIHTQIGMTTTWPQVDVDIDDDEPDIRYALTLNEGYVVKRLGQGNGLLRLSIDTIF